MRGVIRGCFRITVIALVIGLGTVFILATAWIPIRIKGVRLCAWPITYLGRFFVFLFDIQFTCLEPEKFRQHRGFVFPNHISLLDIILLIHILPMRFVSKLELRSWPFIGWIAWAIDTVFVDRGEKDSREKARATLANAKRFPPIVLFPEGGIYKPAETLHPFRYGAFEIATQGSVPFLPCVLLYDPLEIAFWGDESLMTAVWRLASRSGPVRARLFALKVVHPQPNDDPRQLALEAHGAMEAILTYSGREEDVLKTGI